MKYKQLFKIWTKNVGLEVASQMEYKFSFFLRMIGVLLFGFTGPLVGILIYSTTSGIPGWTFHEFLLFQGTGLLVWGIADFCMFSIVWIVMNDVRRGTFDRVLVRPYRPLAAITSKAVDLDGLAQLGMGIVIVTYSLVKLGGATAVSYLTYALLVVYALAIMYAFSVLVSALAFLVTKSFGLFSLFHTFREYARFPISIYGPFFGFLLGFILPVGLASFYPAKALLGAVAWSTVGWLTLSALGFSLLAGLVWKWAMKKYSSAGG